MKIVEYAPTPIIHNGDALPKSAGCEWLLCIRGHYNVLIAKSWHRKQPVAKDGQVLVKFN